jgi:signal transduction histidine kinase
LGTELDDEQREFADTIPLSGQALLSVVNDILDFSKIEARKIALELVPFDLAALVEDVADQSAAHALENGTEIVVEYVPGVPRHLIGDPGRIRQILTNFTSNAVKFTKRGTILVSVSSEGERDGRAHLCISVQDTGMGIPEDRLHQMWDPFTQADSSTTREFGGTGLGLSIAKQLADLMDGVLAVESRLGEGSTFRFELSLPNDPNGGPRAPT